MNEKKDILEFVMGLHIDNHRRSTLSLSLQNARRCCGYQLGVPFTRKEFDLRCQGMNTDDEADMFCALLNYLVVLEQIGTLFYKGRIIEAGNETSALSVLLSRQEYEVFYFGSDADMLELAKRMGWDVEEVRN